MAANAMVAIKSYTITGSAASSVVFTNIPQTYTDLVIVGSVQGQSAGCGPTMYFNTDNNTGKYSCVYVYTDGTTTLGSVKTANANTLDIATTNGLPYSDTTLFAPVTVHIMNYANTNHFKSGLFGYRSVTGGYTGGGDLTHTAFKWSSTAAINQVTMANGNSKLLPVGTTYTLYGIKEA